jgi:hypothetical protein
MPKVGMKEFSYSPAGKKAAAAYAKKTGKSVKGKGKGMSKGMPKGMVKVKKAM